MYANDIRLKKAFVSIITVKKEFRKKALGTVLLKRAENIAYMWGMEYMDLEVDKANDVAIDFYLRNGYVKSEELDASFIMQKELCGNINMYTDRQEWL